MSNLLTHHEGQTIVAAEQRGFVKEERVRLFAVVTGASRGIGAQYAKALAAAGYDLLLVARDEDRLKTLASELRDRHKVVAHTEVMDLALPDSAQRLYVAARQRCDYVDLLINNAGFGAFGPFIDVPMPRIQEMLRLHVNTIVESMRLFLPGMVERSSGAVINVASTAGLFALPFMAEYSATKTFLITFSEALAEEVRPFGVRIQACCPGSTDTDFHQTSGFRANNPLGSDTAVEVVATSLAALHRGPVIIIIGWRGRLVRWVSRFIPATVVTRVAGRWLRQRQARQGDLYRR
jgi:short-subunit dehydrogenase